MKELRAYSLVLSGVICGLVWGNGCSDSSSGGAIATAMVNQITAGLGLIGTPNPITDTGTIDVDFAGTGVAATVSRSDHNHDATYSPVGHNHDATYSQLGHNHDADYLQLAGGTVSGAVSLTNVTNVISGDGAGLTSVTPANDSVGDAQITDTTRQIVINAHEMDVALFQSSPCVKTLYLSHPIVRFSGGSDIVLTKRIPDNWDGASDFQFRFRYVTPSGWATNAPVWRILYSTTADSQAPDTSTSFAEAAFGGGPADILLGSVVSIPANQISSGEVLRLTIAPYNYGDDLNLIQIVISYTAVR